MLHKINYIYSFNEFSIQSLLIIDKIFISFLKMEFSKMFKLLD